MQYFFIIVIITFSTSANGQDTLNRLAISLGPAYNQSSSAFNSTTGLGIFIGANYALNDRSSIGIKVEPTALAHGVLTLPGGCENESPRYPGIPSCREGANYLIGNYISFDYMLGQPKFGSKGGKSQSYIGLHAIILTHKRFIITSRLAGNWKDDRRTITNAGIGLKYGLLLGRFDINLSYNLTGNDFRNYGGFNLGYRIR